MSIKDGIEQIDELSKATLSNYIKLSKKDKNKQDEIAEIEFPSGSGYDASRKSEKREIGIKIASSKLKKEETTMQEVEHTDLSEDMEALFNGETLTEEFKTKAATIFEAAVLTRVKQEVATLEEEFATKLEEQVEEAKTGLVEDVDGLLNYMIEQWMNDNVVALESGIKTEITEGFIKGLHQLFKENYIEVPEDKADLVADLEESVTELKSELTNAIQANINLTKTINESLRTTITDKVSTGLTAVDSEKFRDLVEELSFDNAEIFESKLVTIKENYFTKSTVKTTTQSIITDTPVEHITEEVVTKQPSQRYAAVLKHLNQK